MQLQLFMQTVRLDDDGVGKVEIPDPAENSVHFHLRFERLNDQAITVIFADVVATTEDQVEEFMGALDELGEVE